MGWTRREATSFGVGVAYLLPSLVLFLVFVFVPLGRTIYLSLFNTRSTGVPTTFAGLDNYTELLASESFHTGLVATTLFTLYTVPFGIAIGLGLAVMLNQRLRGINVFRTMMFVPSVSQIVVIDTATIAVDGCSSQSGPWMPMRDSR